MVNKRKNRILDTKKLLHKHGKQWITVSVAMLGALGTGALATHTANAAHINANQPTTHVNAAAHNTAQSNGAANTSNASAQSVKANVNSASTKTAPSISQQSGSQKTAPSVAAVNSLVQPRKQGSSLSTMTLLGNATETGKTATPNMPFTKNTPADEVAPQGVQQIAQGNWGDATWNYYKNGQLDIHDGDMKTNAMPAYFQKTLPGFDGIGANNVVADNVKSIKTYNAIAPQDSESLFSGDSENYKYGNNTRSRFNYLESVDLSGLNTSNVNNMEGMFHGDSYLQNINFGHNFDTKNVTSMAAMFDDCASVKSLDLGSFNTQNVSNYGGMFWNMPSLVSLDISNFNVKPGADFGYWAFTMRNNNYGVEAKRHYPESSLKQLYTPSSLSRGSHIAINNNNIGSTMMLHNIDNHQSSRNWGSAAISPGNWVDVSDMQIYTVNFINEISKDSEGAAHYAGIKNAPFLPVNGIHLPNDYQLAPNAGTTANVVDGTNANIYVVPDAKVQGTWGNAAWMITDNDRLIIDNGQMQTNQMPQALADNAGEVHAVLAVNVAAPNDASNLFSKFTNAIYLNLKGLNFSGTSKVDDMFPDTDASVQLNGSYYDAASAEEKNDYNNNADNITSLKNQLNTDSTSASNAISSADGTIAQNVSSLSNDAKSLTSLSGDNVSLSNAISSAQGTINNDSSAINAWKNSSAGISASLSSAIKSNGTNSASISNLAAKSTADSQGLQNAINKLNTDTTNNSNAINTLSNSANNNKNSLNNHINNNSANASNSASNAEKNADNHANDINNNLNNAMAHNSAVASAARKADSTSASTSASNAQKNANNHADAINNATNNVVNHNSANASASASNAQKNAENYASNGINNLSNSTSNSLNNLSNSANTAKNSLNTNITNLSSSANTKFNSADAHINNVSNSANNAKNSLDAHINNNSARATNYTNAKAQSLATSEHNDADSLSNRIVKDTNSLNGHLAKNTASLSNDVTSLSAADSAALSYSDHEMTNAIFMTNATLNKEISQGNAQEKSDRQVLKKQLDSDYQNFVNVSKTKASWRAVKADENRINHDENIIGTKADKTAVHKAEQGIFYALAMKANASDLTHATNKLSNDIANDKSAVSNDIQNIKLIAKNNAKQNVPAKHEHVVRRNTSETKYVIVTRPARLYYRKGNRMHYVTVKPRTMSSMRVTAVKGSHYIVKIGRRSYSVNKHFVRNAYYHEYNWKRSRKAHVMTGCLEYRTPRFTRKAAVRRVRKDAVLHIKHEVRDNFGRVRFQLSNGHYVTANRNFVRTVK